MKHHIYLSILALSMQAAAADIANQAVKSSKQTVGDTVKSAVQSVAGEAVKTAASKAVDTAKSAVVKTSANTAAETAKFAVTKVGGVKSLTRSAVETAKSTVVKAGDSAKSTAGNVAETAKSAVKVGESAKSTAGNVAETAKSVVKAGESAKSTAGNVAETAKSAATKISKVIDNNPKTVTHRATAQEELSMAQMNYQALLKSQAEDRSDIGRLEARLKNAEKKLVAAQLEVDKIRTELTSRRDEMNLHDSKLKAATERVNKAWSAMHTN